MVRPWPGGNFVFKAKASSNVDLPEPFSPTKKVTGWVNSIDSSARNAGTVKGYFSRPVVFSETAARCKKIISR